MLLFGFPSETKKLPNPSQGDVRPKKLDVLKNKANKVCEVSEMGTALYCTEVCRIYVSKHRIRLANARLES